MKPLRVGRIVFLWLQRWDNESVRFDTVLHRGVITRIIAGDIYEISTQQPPARGPAYARREQLYTTRARAQRVRALQVLGK